MILKKEFKRMEWAPREATNTSTRIAAELLTQGRIKDFATLSWVDNSIICQIETLGGYTLEIETHSHPTITGEEMAIAYERFSARVAGLDTHISSENDGLEKVKTFLHKQEPGDITGCFTDSLEG